jgi:hypothetical protein
MIFESHFPKVTIGNNLRFKPKVLRPGATGRSIRNYFGMLDSRDPAFRSLLGVKKDVSNDEVASRVEKEIMSDPLFRQNYEVDDNGKATVIDNHAIGAAGIWLATDRKGTEAAVIEKSAILERLKTMKDTVLRAIIADAGLPVPSSAGHDELVALAEQASDPNRPALDEAGGSRATRVEGPATRVATVADERSGEEQRPQ